MATKRKDKSRVVLKTGEVQRKDGTYQFSWQDSQMKRRFVYARTLDDLREKEKRIQKDKCDGIKTEARYTTIDELFDLRREIKPCSAGTDAGRRNHSDGRKKVSVWWMQGKTWHGRIVYGLCTDNTDCMRSP